jgi:hypothetical protein
VSSEALDLPEAARFQADRVFDVPPGEAASAVAAGVARPTLWTPDGPRVDLGEARAVMRVAFEVSDGAWVPAPAVGVSTDGREWSVVPGRASLADAALSLYRDPRHGRGLVVFGPVVTRFVPDPRLPARAGALEVEP